MFLSEIFSTVSIIFFLDVIWIIVFISLGKAKIIAFGVGREFLERSGASRHDNRVIRRSPWGGGIVRIADESSLLILCQD